MSSWVVLDDWNVINKGFFLEKIVSIVFVL